MSQEKESKSFQGLRFANLHRKGVQTKAPQDPHSALERSRNINKNVNSFLC